MSTIFLTNKSWFKVPVQCKLKLDNGGHGETSARKIEEK